MWYSSQQSTRRDGTYNAVHRQGHVATGSQSPTPLPLRPLVRRVNTGVDKGAGGPAPRPQLPGKKERKGVFLSDVQHVYLYSLFN